VPDVFKYENLLSFISTISFKGIVLLEHFKGIGVCSHFLSLNLFPSIVAIL
jgi:hypothetical protein